MDKRLIPLLGAVVFGAGAPCFAQDEPAQAAPETAPEAAAPDPTEEAPALAAPEPEPLALARALVEQLAHESYREREAATKKLWELGEVALPALKEGAAKDDPEVAYRAGVLRWRIMTGITADTPPKVVALVQLYLTASPKVKKDVFEKLNDEKAYVQMLRMYHFEEDPASRAACLEYASKAVMPAVLPRLMDDRLDEAEKLLRLAPKTEHNHRRLAALLRVRGTLDPELAATEGAVKVGVDGKVLAESMEVAGLRLALLRSKGSVVEARKLAEQMGRKDIAAALALLEGDPIPYLTWFMNQPNESPVVRVHAETVIKRWQGDDAEADKLMRNVAKVARDGGEEQRDAQLSLLLNGYLDLAIPLVEKNNKESAFGYYETVELPLKALETMGYQGDAAAKKEWLEERLKEIREDWRESDEPRYDIMTLASFLHSRGERDEARRMMLALSTAAAEKGAATWFEFVGRLNNMGSSLYELGFIMAAGRLGEKDEDEEAGKVVSALFGEGDAAPRMWERLGTIEEKPAARVLLMGAVYGVVHMEDAALRAKLNQLMEAADKEEEKERVQSYTDLLVAAESRDDFGMALQLLEKLAQDGADDDYVKKLASYYSYLSDWEKALEQMDKILAKEPNNWHFLALYGGTKIRLGKPEEAAKALARVEAVLLDEPARLSAFAQAVEHTGARKQAGEYWRRLIVSVSPKDYFWESSASDLSRHARLNKQWRVAAALAEVEAMQYMKSRSTYVNPVTYIRRRFAADFFRGLALLEEGDRESAQKLFRRTFDLLNGDASLADDYFPLLREVGMTEEHDRNFDLIYERLAASIKAFPKAHNTYNSAAWLASRASRNLDDALKKAGTALEMRPRQAAYLDTMAEVWFAKRNREKAVEWSSKAVRESYHGGYSGSDGGVGLREQYERFQFDEFPVP